MHVIRISVCACKYVYIDGYVMKQYDYNRSKKEDGRTPYSSKNPKRIEAAPRRLTTSHGTDNS